MPAIPANFEDQRVTNAIVLQAVNDLRKDLNDFRAETKSQAASSEARLRELETYNVERREQVKALIDRVCGAETDINGLQRESRSWSILNSIAAAGAAVVGFLGGK